MKKNIKNIKKTSNQKGENQKSVLSFLKGIQPGLPLVLCLLTLLAGCSKKTNEPTPTDSPKSTTESSKIESNIFEIRGESDFLRVVDGNPIAVIDFNAIWCGPCQKLAPELEQIVKEYANQGVVLGKIDVDANEDISQTFNVQGIPDVRFFVNGQAVDQVVGYDPEKIKKILADLIKKNPGSVTPVKTSLPQTQEPSMPESQQQPESSDQTPLKTSESSVPLEEELWEE